MDIARPIPNWVPSTPAIQAEDVDRSSTGEALAIHFWAPWNGHDPRMDQNIQAVASRFAGRVRFHSCNIDLPANHELCRRFGFVNIPALGILLDGTVRRPIVGCREHEQLAHEIESRLETTERRQQGSFWSRFFRREY